MNLSKVSPLFFFCKHHVYDINLDVKTDQKYIRIHVKSNSESNQLNLARICTYTKNRMKI
jgi:hypothetical protein